MLITHRSITGYNGVSVVTKIIELKKPKLRNPLFIEGLPGVGNVGRIAGGYLVEELKAEKFAELLSSHFMPFVLLHESSSVHLLKNEFYYWRGKKKGQRDLIILIGDTQSMSPEGHTEVVEEILGFVKKFGVKEMITLAGLGVGEEREKPEIIGAVNDSSLVKKYKKLGVKFDAGARVGTIAGASGLLLGLGSYHKIKGVCLLGETTGYPLIPDPNAAKIMLEVLAKILNVKIDTAKIEKKVEEMKEFTEKVEKVQQKALMQMLRGMAPKEKKDKEEELSYIG